MSDISPQIDSPAPNGSSSSHKDGRHSPVAPLAPLEYLQNQRRGSITDPSLHAAPIGSSKLLSNYRSKPDSDPILKSHISDPRPSSPYVFGDATPHPTETNPHIRKLLRSPSIEQNTRPSSALSHHESQGSQDTSSNSALHGTSFLQPVTLSQFLPFGLEDSLQKEQQHPSRPTGHRPSVLRRSSREPQFNYNMRRHSIAVGQDPHSTSALHGTKRKMSADRSVFPPVGEEIDPQLVGPGVPSAMDVDTEPPAPKRRGSAIDTQRIAQLSLTDRRNSVDSRAPAQWWINDRRDSSASIFSNVSSLGGYSSGFTGGDSPHGRLPPGIATFAWPANAHAPDQVSSLIQNEGDANLGGSPRTFDPNNQMGMMPPINFGQDRRMSVPDTLTSGGPTRVLRSRSRPPSRQTQTVDSLNNHSAASSGQEDPASAPSPTGSGKHSKDSSTTPYSRSPELRVSHKLAERKRRKEMKELFDELRDQLPADRGMKASKWEILSKAIDFVAQLKQRDQDMAREIDILRHELDAARQGGMPPFPSGPPPHAVVYTQGSHVPGQFPLPPPPGALQQHSQHPQHQQPRPSSSPNACSTSNPPAGPQSQNGNHRADATPA
ncbi:hypothetical protein BD779DRAFT_1491388 [Infundibulicybe gibba]|nr:hypothetical protein BD779DRAFT_1491388 [Infundibulicybe gibba]